MHVRTYARKHACMGLTLSIRAWAWAWSISYYSDIARERTFLGCILKILNPKSYTQNPWYRFDTSTGMMFIL